MTESSKEVWETRQVLIKEYRDKYAKLLVSSSFRNFGLSLAPLPMTRWLDDNDCRS
jgi:hypothetical protein